MLAKKNNPTQYTDQKKVSFAGGSLLFAAALGFFFFGLLWFRLITPRLLGVGSLWFTYWVLFESGLFLFLGSITLQNRSFPAALGVGLSCLGIIPAM
ncbi:MAG: hypothetical protein H6727_15205, partial [Myxococcales bacterium]|nr:hypothetical protein [Myxococcales bacterium]